MYSGTWDGRDQGMPVTRDRSGGGRKRHRLHKSPLTRLDSLAGIVMRMPSSDARLVKSVVKSAVRGGPAKLGLDANPSAKDTRLLDLELRRLNRPTAVEARRRDGTTISSCDTNGHRKGARCGFGHSSYETKNLVRGSSCCVDRRGWLTARAGAMSSSPCDVAFSLVWPVLARIRP